MTSDARHPTTPTSKARGDAAETRAADFLAARGLVPVAPNYRVARGPQARGEVDLIMHDADGTLVFIEVRAASIGAIKNAGSFSLHSTFCADSRCRHPVASTSSASSGSRRVAARRLTLSLPGSGGGVNRRAKGVSYDP